jgi:glycosyltransferase involved in cell wall biosynthesis
VLNRSLGAINFRCIAPDTIVPATNGAAVRTLNLARIMVPHFKSVSIMCFTAMPLSDERPDGITMIRVPRPAGGVPRWRHLAEMLLSRSFGFRPASPLAPPLTLVQLESPLLFEGARRAGLGRFILDAHNIYRDLADFPQAHLLDSVFYRVTRQRQADVERRCWEAADYVMFCSTVDRDRAEWLLPGLAGKSSVVPNCVDVDQFAPKTANRFGEPGPVLFIGTTRYAPNYHAVDAICRHIAPALPRLEFWVVGDAVLKPRRVPPNVRFLGRVASLAEPLEVARVAIAPLRHGSGTRLKLLECLAAGLPVVCTRKAAEGLDVRDGRHLRFAETFDEFIDVLRALATDAGACQALGIAGRRLVEERYDWNLYVPQLVAMYDRVARC